MNDIIKSLVVIIIAGGIGGVAAWWLTGMMGVEGTLGAIVTAASGMVLAVALFAGLTTLLRTLGWMK
jgi:Trk-type K+ transport system membrane component